MNMNEAMANAHITVAPKFDLVNFIDELPDNIRQRTLFSLTGSLNASLIGKASNLTARLERDGYDLKELSASDISALEVGPDGEDNLAQTKLLSNLAQAWRDNLIALTGRDDSGSLSESLKFLTSHPKQIDSELLETTLKAAGIEGVPSNLLKARYDAQQRERAAELTQNAGTIEWVIEHVFSTDDVAPDFNALDETMQDNLIARTLRSLEKTRDDAVLGVVTGDKRWTLGDVTLITQALKELS